MATPTLNFSATNATTHVAKYVATAEDTHKKKNDEKKGNKMAKPSVSAVKNWEVAYDSDLIKVEVGTAEFHHDYWRINNKATGKKKYFYGELAWQNAHREATDLDWGFLESARG